MGRTRGTYRVTLEHFIEEWQRFRRALRAEYQQSFDDLMDQARRFAAPAGQQNPANPYHGVLMSIVLAQEVERAAMAEEMEDLRERVEELEMESTESDDDAV